MKQLIKKIFGKEAANDKDIVKFYEDVNKGVIIRFVMYLTGYDRATIERMFNEWIKTQ